MELCSPWSLFTLASAGRRNSIRRTVWVCRASVSSVSLGEERLAAAKDMTLWLENQGFPEQPLSLSSFGDKGIGCCAARDLKNGDIALSIPENYTVTAVDIADHPVIANVAEGRNDLIGFTLWLMYEKTRSRESPWYPYLNMLPSSTSSPLLWTTSEQDELLRGSPVLEKIKKQLEALQQQFDALKGSLKDSKGFPLESFTFDAFKTAFAVILSRAVYLPSAELSALVPYGDLINHESSRSVLDYDLESQKVVLRVDKSYKKGEQVFTSYSHNQSSSDLLIRYGFLDEDTENDCIELDASLVKGDPLMSLKREIVQEAGFGVTEKFPLYLNRFPTQLLTYTRLSRIQDSGLFAKIVFNKDVIINPTNEYESLMLIMGDCRTRLLNYSGTAEDEIQILKRKDLSYKERVAAKLRLKEKKILMETVSAMRNRLAPIRGIPTKTGALKDPNSDIIEMFDMVEEVVSAPSKFFSKFLQKDK